MKKSLLPAFALAAVSVGSAFAADLPVRKAPAPAPVVVRPAWTGCYLGAGLGYGMYNNEANELFDDGTVTPSATFGGRGWLGTVQVGCDYQIGASWVIGVFGDYDWADISGDHRTFGFLDPAAFGENTLERSWAVGGRIGWLVTPQLLTYVGGGYTEARFGAINLTFLGDPSPSLSIPERTFQGWFLASGVEYQLGWWRGLFWKTEYRFSDYDSKTTPIVEFGTGIPIGVSEVEKPYVQTVRSSLIWRWNWGP